MKKNPDPRSLAFLLGLILSAAACGSLEMGKLLLEFPGPAAVDLSRTEAVFLTDFWQTKDFPEVDLNKELRTYWMGEVAARFKGPIKTPAVGFGRENLFRDAAFWKELSGGLSRSLILTGRMDLSQETRKALVETESGSIEEPFVKKKGWEARQFFTLEARMFLIDGGTGTIILDREYKETANYPKVKQPPLFALYELLQKVKIKFFRDAFGAPRIQPRYLLDH